MPDNGSLHRRAILYSTVIPGLGQALRGAYHHALGIFLTALGIGGCTLFLARTSGVETAVLFLLVLGLPWWVLQSYGAGLADPLGWRSTLRTVLAQGHDIRYLGALFLLTAALDLFIILARPDYALTVLCVRPSGLWSVLAKAQSPTLHLVIGYGFLRLRRWSLVLYLVYAAFGVINALANFACFGYGRIRTVFLISLLAFTAYVIWRRRCFVSIPLPQAL